MGLDGEEVTRVTGLCDSGTLNQDCRVLVIPVAARDGVRVRRSGVKDREGGAFDGGDEDREARSGESTAGDECSKGNSMVKMVPFPRAERTRILPWMFRTYLATTASPRPNISLSDASGSALSLAGEVSSSSPTCSNYLKRSSSCLSDMPTPIS